MIRQNHKQPWYVRLAQGLGIDPFSRQGRTAIAGTSKHARGRMKPRDWRRKAKIRHKMAAASRRRNRGQR